MKLSLKGIRFEAGDFSLEVDAEFGASVTGLFGVSGSGKSTLVELVAGLRHPAAGRIVLAGEVLTDVAAGIFVAPDKRGVGFVPQEGALFPHLTVDGNLRFAERRGRAQARELFRREHVCTLLGIEELLPRSPASLSGGERQRVAIARALVSGPRLLLLDEPLAGLDAARKSAVLPYLQKIRGEFDIPILYVSHVPQEMLALCGDMAVLANGRLLQQGAVEDVFRRPSSPEVARIVGVETVVPGRLLEEGELAAVAVGSTRVVGMADRLASDTADVLVSIRAEDVYLIKAGSVDGVSARNRLPGRVTSLVVEGAIVRVELDCGFLLTALVTRQAVAELQLVPGSRVVALVKAPNVHLIPQVREPRAANASAE